MHIVNSADDNYVPHVGAMLHSLFQHDAPENICFHFLHSENLPDKSLKKLGSLCERFGADFQPLKVDTSLLNGFPLSERFPVEAWYRVVLPSLLPRLDKVLWLDADTLALDSVLPLWQHDISEYPLAACPNPVLYSFRGLMSQLDITDRSKYFNSGVMLLNLKLMREENYDQQLRALGRKYFEWVRFADQDVLNAAYINRYLPLPMEWNVLTHSYLNVPETRRVFGPVAYRKALRAPKVVHFTGTLKFKPWSYRCGHPFRDDYLYHRAEAGWPLFQFPDQSLRNWIVRNLPLRLRVILDTFLTRRFGEMMSYIRQW
jgi:lipopolysaccharide biosynthesis glycosyltransferase